MATGKIALMRNGCGEFFGFITTSSQDSFDKSRKKAVRFYEKPPHDNQTTQPKNTPGQ